MLDIDPNDAESIAQSLIPVMDSDAKTRYLGLRSCGFTIRESAKLVPITEGAIRNWRHTDPIFKRAEDNIREFREEMSKEHINLEFTRNYLLVLEKDYNVLVKSVNSPYDLTKQEHEYLLKLRSHYTPQQLDILQRLFRGESGEPFDLTKFILRFNRTHEEVTIEGTNWQQG